MDNKHVSCYVFVTMEQGKTTLKETFGREAMQDIGEFSEGLIQVNNQAQWKSSVWHGLVEFVNAVRPTRRDTHNISALVLRMGFGSSSRAVQEARKDRKLARNILEWLANPGLDVDVDARAMRAVSEHYGHITHTLEPLRTITPVGLGKFTKSGYRATRGFMPGPPVDVNLVSRRFLAPHFLDLVARFIYDSLVQTSNQVARLSMPPPIRMCAKVGCERFFVRHGKISKCEEHRDETWSLPPDMHRRRKWLNDQIKMPIKRLKRGIDTHRIRRQKKDRGWKEKMAMQIWQDRKDGNKKSAADYLPIPKMH